MTYLLLEDFSSLVIKILQNTVAGSQSYIMRRHVLAAQE